MASRLLHATFHRLYAVAFGLFLMAGDGVCMAMPPQMLLDDTTRHTVTTRSGLENPRSGLEKSEGLPVVTESIPDTTTTNINEPQKRKGNILKRFFKSFDDYDTSYISPNYYNYTAMLQNTNFYQIYFMKGSDEDGRSQTLQMSPSPSLKVGPYFGWRWIFLGYTFDIMHPKNAVKTTEFNLSLYSSMLGCDFVYINNKGDFTLRKVSGFDDDVAHSIKDTEFSGMEASTLSFTAYYVLNHRHFSYPAAYAQSTVQRKSCGSWMFGLSYTKQHIDFDYTRLPAALITASAGSTETPLMDELKISKIDYQSYSVSAGYAYNWVFAHNWLFSISLMPSLGFKQAKGERIKGEDIWINMKNLKFDFIGRSGLVWNNGLYFAGASVVSHFYDYQKNTYAVRNLVNYVNVYAGFMFGRKSQYRRR